MEKMRSFVLLSCLHLELWSLRCHKWLIFCFFSWCQQKISHTMDKLFMCIWKILFSSLRKCYGLLDINPWRYKVLLLFADWAVFWYFYPQYLTNSNSKIYESYHFHFSISRPSKFSSMPVNMNTLFLHKIC